MPPLSAAFFARDFFSLKKRGGAEGPFPFRHWGGGGENRKKKRSFVRCVARRGTRGGLEKILGVSTLHSFMMTKQMGALGGGLVFASYHRVSQKFFALASSPGGGGSLFRGGGGGGFVFFSFIA